MEIAQLEKQTRLASDAFATGKVAVEIVKILYECKVAFALFHVRCCSEESWEDWTPTVLLQACFCEVIQFQFGSSEVVCCQSWNGRTGTVSIATLYSFQSAVNSSNKCSSIWYRRCVLNASKTFQISYSHRYSFRIDSSQLRLERLDAVGTNSRSLAGHEVHWSSTRLRQEDGAD